MSSVTYVVKYQRSVIKLLKWASNYDNCYVRNIIYARIKIVIITSIKNSAIEI